MKPGLFVAVLVLLAACGGGEKSPVELGRIDYLRTCALCHGPEGRGAGKLGNPLVGTDYMRTTSDEEVALLVKTGRVPSDPANTTGMLMPPRGADPRLTDEDVKNIVLYVRTFPQPSAAPP